MCSACVMRSACVVRTRFILNIFSGIGQGVPWPPLGYAPVWGQTHVSHGKVTDGKGHLRGGHVPGTPCTMASFPAGRFGQTQPIVRNRDIMQKRSGLLPNHFGHSLNKFKTPKPKWEINEHEMKACYKLQLPEEATAITSKRQQRTRWYNCPLCPPYWTGGPRIPLGYAPVWSLHFTAGCITAVVEPAIKPVVRHVQRALSIPWDTSNGVSKIIQV